MDVPQVFPETNSQVEPGRVEEVVPLGDLLFGAVLEYLEHHKLQVERFEWSEDGPPVLYCEHRKEKD